nr:DUF92 domain-containing protein [Anaeromonas gelatinilytica]
MEGDITIYIYRLIIGLIFSGFISILAYKKKSLTKSGMIGAIILGTIIYITTGLYGASTMILFFISSSLLSHYKKRYKENVAKQFDKTGNRDLIQVFANGGVGLLYGILYMVYDSPIHLVLLAASFAAANADTWSTEIGVLNNKPPLSLRSFRRVPKGTSGAVSPLGTLVGFLGSLLIGVYSILYMKVVLNFDISLTYIIIIAFAGLLGSLIDSVFGAFFQGIYIDEKNNETEKKFINGKKRKLKRGISFFNNDIVNFLSIFIATLLSILII